MAKSLRAKNKQKNKTLKRSGFFGDMAKQRELRIAERLSQGSAKQAVEQLKQELIEKKEAPLVTAEAAEPAEGMDVDQPVKRISTSGWKHKKKHGNKRRSRK